MIMNTDNTLIPDNDTDYRSQVPVRTEVCQNGRITQRVQSVISAVAGFVFFFCLDFFNQEGFVAKGQK